MNAETLTTFFMWCTIINGGLLILSTLLCMALKNVIATMHGKLFGITPEATKTAVYGYLGLFKILWFIFNVVPYVALLIAT
jgi:hypothetical protein